MKHNIQPVFLGADMNCYSMARTFHEAYGVPSYAYGRYAMGETKYSRIVRFTPVHNIDDDDVMLQTLKSFAKNHPGTKKILLGCTDGYVEMIIRNRKVLQQDFIVPYIDEALKDTLVSKESFYKHCENFGIPYPDTVVIYKDSAASAFENTPFGYPVIIKASSSIAYWEHAFDGMKKVYVAHSPAEAKEITDRIFASGYPDSIILQDKIPGPDCEMRVLTGYSGKDGKVKMMCLGNVLLEEHAPTARGNHAAIITEYNRPLMEKLQQFLDSIGYIGYSNFDIKYDTRDGQYKVFEINLRQGRSNYYVTGAGVNLSEYVVKDYVYGDDFGETLFFNEASYWRSIPDKVVWNYTDSAELVRKAKELKRQGKSSTALDYTYDTRLNPLRWAYLKVHYYRYFEKYATHCPKPKR